MAGTSKPVVVLFDVDETSYTPGAREPQLVGGVRELYGIPADIGEHSSAGETDPQVARATFRAVIGHDPTDVELDQLMSTTSATWRTTSPSPPATGCCRGRKVWPRSERPACCSAWCPGRWRERPAPAIPGTSIGSSSSAPRLPLTGPRRADRHRHREGHPPPLRSDPGPGVRRRGHPPRRRRGPGGGSRLRGRGQRSHTRSMGWPRPGPTTCSVPSPSRSRGGDGRDRRSSTT